MELRNIKLRFDLVWYWAKISVCRNENFAVATQYFLSFSLLRTKNFISCWNFIFMFLQNISIHLKHHLKEFKVSNELKKLLEKRVYRKLFKLKCWLTCLFSFVLYFFCSRKDCQRMFKPKLEELIYFLICSVLYFR